MDTENRITGLRDASFSCYLNTAEDNFVLKLTDTLQFRHPMITSGQEETYAPMRLERTKAEEGEIGVFSAEKYFNRKPDDGSPRLVDNNAGRHANGKGNRIDHGLRTKSRPGTPSASSETSWNSRTPLLPSFLGNSAQNRQRKLNERWFFASFACNGTCSGKKSVYIDKTVAHRGLKVKEHAKEAIQVPRNPVMLGGRKQSQLKLPTKDELDNQSAEKMSVGSNREEYFVLPAVNSGVQSFKLVREEQKTKEEDPRKSLEVFGSHMIKKEDIARNLEKKLSVLTWDAIPKAKNLPTASTTSQVHEEAESEASSDLFEIESTSRIVDPVFTKQISDGLSMCMSPRSRYETSDIDWSVAAASNADFSAVSDYGEKKPTVTNSCSVSATRRSRPIGLLGCRSHKAVEVAEAAHKKSEKAKVQPATVSKD